MPAGGPSKGQPGAQQYQDNREQCLPRGSSKPCPHLYPHGKHLITAMNSRCLLAEESNSPLRKVTVCPLLGQPSAEEGCLRTPSVDAGTE